MIETKQDTLTEEPFLFSDDEFKKELSEYLKTFIINMKNLNVKPTTFPEWFEMFMDWSEVGTCMEKISFGPRQEYKWLNKTQWHANDKLFNWIYSSVISEGGDGDLVIGFTHQDYVVVAKEFKSWLWQTTDTMKMEIKENHVLFVDNQEYIVFTNKENFDKISNHGPRILTW